MLGMLLLMTTFACGVLACGGAVGGGVRPGNLGTTPGAYSVTVTGVSGSTTEQGAITLTVQ
jgi:hypothetical protein